MENVDLIHVANIALGTLIPLLVALVTKEVASSGLKGTLNALLSAVAGALTIYVSNNGAVELAPMVVAGAEIFVVSIATYYGVYKSTGITATVQSKTAEVGVGGGNRFETHEKQGRRL